ncbi:substrate-binding periplasmic protein [Acuticoccus kandeliae]|uniref:substrate-binding periplasmic protein n=1 Tax=Acuticoccus kandeliae TaxID=2073160 RepID=UPI000D3E9B10|nr:transporter substrate-binding domain-containing protein [Acuticoccus kandeliae]
MNDKSETPRHTGVDRRSLLTGAAVAGVAGVALAATSVREVKAQLLDSGIPEDSVLNSIRAGGALRVGYAQTPLWFYKDAKSGELRGVYKELVERLATDLEMTVDWQEVTFANATVGLRKNDFDLFGSSAVYTIPRALACNYVGPLWSKGSSVIVHKDDAERFKTIEDLNSADVTFSVSAGSSEEQRLPGLFPEAKFMAISGQQVMAAEPVRTKRATAYVVGDSDALALVKRNGAWAHIVDVDNPFDKRPNTWLIRHGDPAWKFFLDTWANFVITNGQVQRLYDQYLSELA